MSALSGQTVVVLGLAASGRAAARLAVSLGATVIGLDRDQTATPIKDVRLELGPHSRQTFLAADLIIVSPGIPAALPDLVAAHNAGVALISELAFAARYATVPLIGITGTNGKSTVTWFVQQLLKAAGMDPFVGGNLGRPASEAVGTAHDVWVLEVSSYQLELPGTLRPRVAIVLNLTPDHLARHGDMDGYAKVKTDLFAQQGVGDIAILPVGDARLAKAASRYTGATSAQLGALPGVIRSGDDVSIEVSGVSCTLSLAGLTVPGEHNKDNAATAALLAIAAGADPALVAAAIPALEGLEHRMEVVGQADGVLFINDSKATNIDAARTGIGGMDRSSVVLLGGESKGAGFAALADLLKQQRAVVTFGGDGPQIADELAEAGVSVFRAASMEGALEWAIALAEPGDAVLLSPGCASFDAYQNFAHRGRVFRELVQAHLHAGAPA